MAPLRRIVLAAVTGGLYACALHAAPASFNAISRDLQSGALSAPQAAEYRLYAVVAPERLPAAYRLPEPVTEHPVRRSSIELATVKRDAALLPKAVQVEFASFLARPSLPQVRETAHFKIHYSSSGANRVTSVYLDSVAAAAEFVWNREVGELGYDAPPVDNVSDPKYDIYILNMSDAYFDLYYGLTYMEAGGGAGYMEIDNNYAEPDYSTHGVTGMQVTLAHEFFHAIQYGYAGFPVSSSNAWWMEISSTWMEDMVYDGIDDYLQYLAGSSGWFAMPYKSLFAYDGWHEYGSCIFNHYLAAEYGSGAVRAIWEAGRSTTSAEAAVNNGLNGYGTSFDRAYLHFMEWLLYTGSRADTAVYFPEGHLYPEIAVVTEHNLASALAPLWTQHPAYNLPAGDYSCCFIKIDSLQAIDLGENDFSFSDQGGDRWGGSVFLQDSSGLAGPQAVTMLGGKTGIFAFSDSTDVRSMYVAAGMLEKGTAPLQFSYGFSISELGLETELLSCFPNPYKPAEHDGVYFPFTLSSAALDITIGIYTAGGQLVRTIGVNPSFPYEYTTRSDAAMRNAVWDGTNEAGRPVAAGTYYYRFSVGDTGGKGFKTLAVIR